MKRRTDRLAAGAEVNDTHESYDRTACWPFKTVTVPLLSLYLHLVLSFVSPYLMPFRHDALPDHGICFGMVNVRPSESISVQGIRYSQLS